jgi:hypothetical protein
VCVERCPARAEKLWMPSLMVGAPPSHSPRSGPLARRASSLTLYFTKFSRPATPRRAPPHTRHHTTAGSPPVSQVRGPMLSSSSLVVVGGVRRKGGGRPQFTRPAPCVVGDGGKKKKRGAALSPPRFARLGRGLAPSHPCSGTRNRVGLVLGVRLRARVDRLGGRLGGGSRLDGTAALSAVESRAADFRRRARARTPPPPSPSRKILRGPAPAGPPTSPLGRGHGTAHAPRWRGRPGQCAGGRRPSERAEKLRDRRRSLSPPRSACSRPRCLRGLALGAPYLRRRTALHPSTRLPRPTHQRTGPTISTHTGRLQGCLSAH